MHKCTLPTTFTTQEAFACFQCVDVKDALVVHCTVFIKYFKAVPNQSKSAQFSLIPPLCGCELRQYHVRSGRICVLLGQEDDLVLVTALLLTVGHLLLLVGRGHRREKRTRNVRQLFVFMRG